MANCINPQCRHARTSHRGDKGFGACTASECMCSRGQYGGVGVDLPRVSKGVQKKPSGYPRVRTLKLPGGGKIR